MIISNSLHEIAGKKERALYGTQKRNHLGRDIPHRLPESVRSFYASKKPKLLKQRAFFGACKKTT